MFTIPAKGSPPKSLPISISDSRAASLPYRQTIQHRQINHARQLTIPTLFSSDTFTRGMFIISANYSTTTNCSAPSNYSAPSNLYARQRIQPCHFPPLTCLPYRQPIQHRQTSGESRPANCSCQHTLYRYIYTVTIPSAHIYSAARYQHANHLIQSQHNANTKDNHCQ